MNRLQQENDNLRNQLRKEKKQALLNHINWRSRYIYFILLHFLILNACRSRLISVLNRRARHTFRFRKYKIQLDGWFNLFFKDLRLLQHN